MGVQNGAAVSYHERYGVACMNTGYESRIVLLVTYASTALLPSQEFLRDRVGELQRLFPLLSARVVDAKTRNPMFERRTPWDVDQVLRRQTYELQHEATANGTDDSIADGERRTAAELLNRESDTSRPAESDEPMWTITLYTTSPAPPSDKSKVGQSAPPLQHDGTIPFTSEPATSAATPPSPKAYLALSSSHCLIDALGLARLLSYLLTPSLSTLDLKPEPFNVPILEETIPIKPRLGILLPIAFQELVVPKLPGPLRRVFKPDPEWPYDPIALLPIRAKTRRRLVSFPKDKLDALKRAGKANRCPRLHSIVWLSWIVALYATSPVPSRAGSGSGSERSKPWKITTSAPRSERDPALGHSAVVANYISAFSTKASLRPSDKFWSLARELDANLHSARGIRDGRGEIGLWAYVPDAKPDPKMAETTRPTGWENFYLDKAESLHPCHTGIEVSNLGQRELPPGAEDVCWTQSDAFATHLLIDVLGCEDGLRTCLCWKEGVVLSEKQIIRMQQVWERVVDQLVAGGNDSVDALIA